MKSNARVLSLTLVAVLACGTAGCSLFKSSSSPSRWSGKSSKSSSSPSRWSSGSSGGDSEAAAPEPAESAYFEDVRDYTSAAVASHQTADDLARGLGPLARSHGLTDWEADPTTLRAVGAGLASAGVTPDRLEDYKMRLARGDLTRSKLILEGYQSSSAQ